MTNRIPPSIQAGGDSKSQPVKNPRAAWHWQKCQKSSSKAILPLNDNTATDGRSTVVDKPPVASVRAASADVSEKDREEVFGGGVSKPKGGLFALGERDLA
jgi:hypothetical protein